MKQAQMPIIAFGLFFATKFSTARYLLVEIDEGADGTRPEFPAGILDPCRSIKLHRQYIYSQFILTLIFCFICIVSGLGQRCEPLREKHQCKDVKGSDTIGVDTTSTECQDLCEKHRVGVWGCCEYQLSGECTFYVNSLEAEPASFDHYAAQCGGEG